MPSPASTGQIGYGSKVEYSSDGVTYTKIGQTIDIKGPAIKVPSVKISNNDSPNGTAEKVYGLIDVGPLTFNFLKTGAIYNTVFGLLRNYYYWRVTDAQGSIWVCQGFVTSIEPGIPLEDKETVDVEVDFYQKPTFTA